jgi:hypothetical protein
MTLCASAAFWRMREPISLNPFKRCDTPTLCRSVSESVDKSPLDHLDEFIVSSYYSPQLDGYQDWHITGRTYETFGYLL